MQMPKKEMPKKEKKRKEKKRRKMLMRRPPIGHRRKVTEKSSAVKEHCISLPVLQNNEPDTWSELGVQKRRVMTKTEITTIQICKAKRR